MAKYDDQFRTDAVLMLEAAGYPDQKGALTRVSEHLHVPLSTLSRWFKGTSNPPPSNIVSEKRFDLIDAIRAEIQAIFGELPDARSEANYKDMTTAAAILIDKLQLLTGQPTDIQKQIRELSDTERASRITDLLDRARARRDGRADMVQ